MDIVVEIAYAALALLVAALAVYLALRLLGKFAKFIIFLVIVAVLLWFFLSDHSILRTVLGFARGVGGQMERVRDMAAELLP